jgi:hypothetical protein
MPWFVEGEYQGMMEIVFEIPFDVPHFIRDKPVVEEEPVEENSD